MARRNESRALTYIATKRRGRCLQCSCRRINYTNFSQQEPGGAVTILLLDVLNTPQVVQIYARKAMVEFLRRLPPGQSVGLYILSDQPRLVQGFTSSSDVLIAAGKALGLDVSLRGPAATKTLVDPISQILN